MISARSLLLLSLISCACGTKEVKTDLSRPNAPLPSAWKWQARCCPDYSGVIAGEKGQLWAIGSNGNVRWSADGGASWQEQTTGATETLHEIRRDPRGWLWVTGGMSWQGGGVLLKSEGSGKWERIALPLDTCLHGIAFYRDRIFVGGDDGYVFQSADAGKTWSYKKIAGAQSLYWMYAAPDGREFSGGGAGGTYVSSSDGDSWTVRSLNYNQDQQEMFATRDGRLRWIVGLQGLILHSADDGKTWERQDGKVASKLNDIAGLPDGSKIVAAGSNGTLLATEDMGRTWQHLYQPTGEGLTDLAVAPDGSGWFAVGVSGTVLVSPEGKTWSSVGKKDAPDYYTVRAGNRAGTAILGGSDSLSRWEAGNAPVPIPLSRRESVNALAATRDRTTFWAVGDDHFVAHSDNGGDDWKVLDLPAGLQVPADADLASVLVEEDRRTVWIVGEQGVILRSPDAGATWARQTSPTKEPLNAIFVAADHRNAWITGNSGVLLRTGDSGVRWDRVEIPFHEDLGDITGAPDGSLLWAASGKGAIMKSSDFGRTWTSIRPGADGDFNGILQSADGRRIWAAGDKGTLAASNDGGDKWSVVHLPNSGDLISADVDPRSGELFVAGQDGALYRSGNGIDWRGPPAGKQDSITDSLNGVAVSADGKRMWAVGESGLLMSSSDGGAAWSQTRLGDDDLNDIQMDPSSGSLWVCGDSGKILRSTDGGRNWESPPTPTKQNLRKILVAGDARLWAVGDETILKSEDKGATWRTYTSRGDLRPENFDLLDIGATPDGKEIWIAAQGSRVYQSTDYGSSWTYRGISNPSNVSSVAVSPDASRIWVGMSDGQVGRFLKSTQGYTVFTTSSRAVLWQLLQTKIQGELWAISASGSLKHSTDYGWTWNNAALPTSSELHAAALARDTGAMVIVGENGLVLTGKPIAPLPHILRAGVRQDAIANRIRLDLDSEGMGHIDTSQLKLYGAKESAWKLSRWDEIKEIEPKVDGDGKHLTVSFAPDQFQFDDGDPVYFEVSLHAGGMAQRIALPRMQLRRWVLIRDHPAWTAVIVAILLFYLTMTAFLFVRPLAILAVFQKTGFMQVLEGLPIPLLGDLVKGLSLGTFLPLYVKNSRVLDAWVLTRREQLESQWGEGAAIGDPANVRAGDAPRRKWEYVPLPIDVLTGAAVRRVREPAAADLLSLLEGDRQVVQIVGEGGAGKSTLAREIVISALRPPRAVGRHAALSVWIAEEVTDLSATLRDKLKLVLNEDVDETFLNALLRKQRLLVVVDGLSERSAATQQYIAVVPDRMPVNGMTITSRRSADLRVRQKTEVRPMQLSSETLLTLMLGFLNQWRQRRDAEAGEDERQTRMSTSDQLDLGRRLADLAMLSGDEIPITPLLVRLYVERAIDLLDRGRSLEDLPGSIPEVYFDYLRQVNAASPDGHLLDSEEILKICCALGKLTLGENLIPGSFTGWEATQSQGASGHVRQAPIRLVDSGVLRSAPAGADSIYTFTSDPLAEFVGAFAWAQYCGQDPTRWKELGALLERQGKLCDGFRVALALTLTAYAEKMRWRTPGDFPTVRLLAESAKRATEGSSAPAQPAPDDASAVAASGG